MRDHGSRRRITAQDIASLPRSPFCDLVFRHQAPNFDPRSGEGAKELGGRFNPAASFATLYATPEVPTAVAEFYRLGDLHYVGVDGLLPRELYKYSIELHEVIDLTASVVTDALGIEKAVLIDGDRSLTQLIGESAFALGVQAIVSFSASCSGGTIIAVFLENLHGCDICPELIGHWTCIQDLNRSANDTP